MIAVTVYEVLSVLSINTLIFVIVALYLDPIMVDISLRSVPLALASVHSYNDDIVPNVPVLS